MKVETVIVVIMERLGQLLEPNCHTSSPQPLVCPAYHMAASVNSVHFACLQEEWCVWSQVIPNSHAVQPLLFGLVCSHCKVKLSNEATLYRLWLDRISGVLGYVRKACMGFSVYTYCVLFVVQCIVHMYVHTYVSLPDLHTNVFHV